jgi:hypothetical protein
VLTLTVSVVFTIFSIRIDNKLGYKVVKNLTSLGMSYLYLTLLVHTQRGCLNSRRIAKLQIVVLQLEK